MTNTDFFDDDLIQHRDSVKRLKMGPVDERVPGEPSDAPADIMASRAVSDLNLTRMARHKEEVEGQVARAMEELERLRQKQEALEREKRALTELRKKQEDYEQGRNDILAHLNQSILTLEKEEVRTQQTSDLLAATRKQFRSLLSDIEALNDESWAEEEVRVQLDKALTLIGDARLEYNKAMAKIQAVAGAEGGAAEAQEVLGPPSAEPAAQESFGQWFKMGLAFSLPLIITLVLLAVLVCVLRSQAYL